MITKPTKGGFLNIQIILNGYPSYTLTKIPKTIYIFGDFMITKPTKGGFLYIQIILIGFPSNQYVDSRYLPNSSVLREGRAE